MTRTLLPLLLGLLSATPAAAEDWLMIGRGGECFPIRDVLEQKLPDAVHVRGPDAFVSHLRGRGYEVIRREEKMQWGRLVAIQVPALKLGFGFAERSLCENFPKPTN